MILEYKAVLLLAHSGRFYPIPDDLLPVVISILESNDVKQVQLGEDDSISLISDSEE